MIKFTYACEFSHLAKHIPFVLLHRNKLNLKKMKTKITLLTASACLWLSCVQAQTLLVSPPPCNDDLNGFVSFKNVGGTGAYQLQNGFEEKASQTYNYSGPGKITSVRVYGSYPGIGILAGVPLKFGVYNVDASGKPTTLIASSNHTWWSIPDNSVGYINVTFPGGVTVNNRFAVTVEITSGFPFGNVFNLQYTGNGEGGGQDLASLAGTSTGNNWSSAKNSFGKDGDFYIVPNMSNINSPSFTTASSCYSIGSSITFSNTTQMTKDSMFNKIALPRAMSTNTYYAWNFGDGSAVSNAMNPSHTYTAGGAYTTTLTTKIEGWSGVCTKTFTSSVSVGLAVTSTSVVNVNCNGANNGSFVASAHFGAAPYTYNKNGGSWQSSPNFTGLIAGTYTLNIKDAKGCTNSTVVTITEPAGISINPVLITNASCGTNSGALTASSSGGVAPLTYKLDGGSFLTSGTFSSLSAGPHLLTVKDANGCSTSTLVIINSLTGPILLLPNINNVSCFGGNDGSITLTSFGGTGSVQYSINGGITYQSIGIFTGVTAGSYTCVVKDNAGCTNHTHINVYEGPSLVLTTSAIPALCNGASNGQINVSSTGGTGTRNYSLNGTTYQSGSNFSGLAAGIYTVYVKDVTSCVITQTVAVTAPTALTASLSTVAASCNSLENGSITALAAGGNGGYSYSLGDGYSSVGTFNNLPAGSYTVSIMDMNNCSLSSVISVSQPPAITTTVNTTNATCTFTNGSIMVVAAGGSGSGYQYSIDGVTFAGTGSFSSLNAGVHFVVVKDGSGCNKIVSGVIISAGGPTITASSSQNVSCHGGKDGSVTINTISGGTGTILYSTDGVSFQTSNVLTDLSAGTYVIQVKDANGCIASVTKVITQPNAFLIAPSTTSVSCYGGASGSATIAASGGAGFLAYSLNGGFSFQSGTVFNSLSNGSYTVLVKDAANCVGSSTFTIVQPTEITALIGSLNSTCYGANNGEIHVNAFGGTSPYLYSINGTTYSSANSFTGLTGNTNYVVYVKDANNCIITTNHLISEPALLNLTSSINNVSCAGGNNGMISLNLTGGVTPYSIYWSTEETSSSIGNLPAGVYSVLVTDFNGCTGVKTFTVTQPSAPLIVNGVINDASSSSSLNGSIDITPTGGTNPYTYIWSNGATTQDISGLNPGSYMVTTTDWKGCTSSMTFNVGIAAGIANVTINAGEVKVYPNPANEFATIEALGYKIDKVEFVNLLGQTVFASEVNASVARVYTSDLLNGTYFVKVYINNNTITKKINISK